MYKLYTQQNCPNCEALKSFLDEQGLAFEELDINMDTKARAFMIMNDLELTPTLVADGRIISGDVDSMKVSLRSII